MKSPNNRADRAPTGHLSASNEASRTRNGLHLIKFLFKNLFPWNPQTAQAVAKARWFSAH